MTNPRDNSTGSATIAAWYQTSTKGRYTGIDGSTIIDEIIVECDVIEMSEEISCVKTCAAELVVETAQEFIMPDVYTYLRNAETRYRTIKTLLYNDQPKSLYDFYVCNDIRCRTTNSRENRHPPKVCLIEGGDHS